MMVHLEERHCSDGPYYIDPDYFQGVYGNPDPSKTYTKPDGRVGVNTADAVNWWQIPA